MSKELTANGKLRVGIAYAPAPTPLFIVKDANGTPRGVTVDLGKALAEKLGVSVEFVIAPNTGLLTDELEAGNIDVSFMPVDEERKKRIAFGTVYFLVESTYLATGASGIKTVEEVDRAGVRVVGIANTTTIRAAGRALKNTTITAAESIDKAVEMVKSGKADAFALSRDSLPPFVKQLPGSCIVEGSFQQTGVAVAVPKGRPDALVYVSAFIDAAKESGLVRKAFDRAGLNDLDVAP
jgi:polar amino acid transport system substrate-binding protein